MRKIALVLIMISSMIVSISAQDVKNEQTKMETFASKTGVITRFQDYSLPVLKLKYGVAESRVRKLTSGTEDIFFYQIEKKGQYDTKIASIEYSDLKETIKAVETLKGLEDSDISLNPDYLENKFVTEDGFQVGYYISKGKSIWYLKLEKYGSDNTVFLNLEVIEDSFNAAMQKMEELGAK